MLKLLWRPLSAARAAADPTREDLGIRNLLDDPDLRRVMGLEQAGAASTKMRRTRQHGTPASRLPADLRLDFAGAPTGAAQARPVPERRFDRRQLLDGANA